ncbi:MAG: DUF4388 domain-containing protein [bacterium]|nr:DUF4388 domain-containing protein [bacterium]
MTIQGSLESVNLADIFQLIGFGQKTGKLNIEAEHSNGEVYFQNGNIYFVKTSENPFNLDKILTDNHLIGSAEIKTLKKAVEKNKTNLIDEIISAKLLTQEQLSKVVIDHFSLVLYSFFRLKSGRFHFEPEITNKEMGSLDIRLNINNIIMEGSRRIDEWELIEEIIPKSTTVFRFTKDFDKKILNIELHHAEKEVLRLIDGKKDVKSLRKAIGIDEFETMKILFSLIQAKIIEVIPEEEVEKISEYYNLGQFYFERENYDEAILELKQVLQHNHLAIYVINLLGTIFKKKGMIDSDVVNIINNADFNYLKVGGVTEEGKALIEEIYKKKPIKVKKPEESLETAGTQSTASAEGKKDDLVLFQTYYKQAVDLFKKEDYDGALSELENARKINDSSYNVYLMIGNILFKKKDFKGAVENWQKSLEINPENDKLQKNLDMIKKKLKI